MTTQETIRLLKMEMLGDSEQMKCAKQIAVEALAKQIQKADTERHAHWDIWDEDTNTYECSNCKNPFTLLEGTPEQNTYFYCPYCGCKMIVVTGGKLNEKI